MKIGDFARLCGTRISVLQHYDKVGVLRPLYTDRFTNYRYYDPSQAVLFERIRQLKAAGFALKEIRQILYTDMELSEIFAKRKAVLEQQLSMLEQLKNTISGGIRMEQVYIPLVEDIDFPFENDEEVIGKWLLLGEEDNSKPSFLPGDKEHYLYFLPRGERYWIYRWTKGKLLVETGTNRFANDYHIGKCGDDLYMTVFDPAKIRRMDPYFKEIIFSEGGHCASLYGEKWIQGDDMQVWTRGYVLRKWNSTACAYEFRRADGREYLIMEWKSGDYLWGGYDTDYYVFLKEEGE